MEIAPEFGKFSLLDFTNANLKHEVKPITNPNFEQGIALFAVFDGHGGLECAKFCEKFFEPKLKE